MALQVVGDLSSSIHNSNPPCWRQSTSHENSFKFPFSFLRNSLVKRRNNKATRCHLYLTGYCTENGHKHALHMPTSMPKWLVHGRCPQVGSMQSTWLANTTFTCSPRNSLNTSAKSVAFTQEISVKEQYQTESNVSIQNTAHISVRGVKVEGLDDNAISRVKVEGLHDEPISSGENEHLKDSGENVVASAGVDDNGGKRDSCVQDDDSATTGLRKAPLSLGSSLSDFKSWWNAVNESYKNDTATWGYGTSPIFTVYEGPGGKVVRVTINEEEIKRRQGVEPLLIGLIDNASKGKAEENILLAQRIASDLEQGRIFPNKHSTIFTLVKPSSEGTNQTTRQKLVHQVDVLVYRAAPVIKSVFMIAVPLYGIAILYGAYLMIRERSGKDVVQEDKSAARLEKMRKLKAQMATKKGDSGVVKSPVAPSEFMKKLLEVREMARQVRTEESLQGAGQNANAESRGEDSVDTGIVGDTVEAEERVAEAEDAITKIENWDGELNITGSIEVKQSGIDSILPSRMKPPIIPSLEEGIAVIGESKPLEEVCSNSEKHEETMSDTQKPQVDQESIHVSDLLVSSDDQDGSFKPGLQGAGGIFDGGRESESRGQDNPNRENVGDNGETEERVSEIESGMTQHLNQDAEVTTAQIVEATRSGSDMTSGTRVKPRIIMSLDEAIAVIEETKTLDKDWTSSKHMKGTMSETYQESIDVNKPNVLHGSSTDRGNGLIVDQIMPGVDSGQPERQNTESLDVEVASSDVNGKLTWALDKAPEGKPREEQEARETYEEQEVKEVSDGLKHSDKAASLPGWKEVSENGKLAEETGMSPSTSSRQGSKDYGRLPNRRRKASLSRKSTKPSILSLTTKDVVGSGQPLQEREAFTNTKRWSEELQRKYDSERDPEVRDLMKEIGSELDSWVTEEEIEEAFRLSLKLEEGGEEDAVHKQYEKVQKKIKEEKEKFGLEAVMEKYKEYQPKPQDELWWLDLRCVLCLMVASANKEEGGFYGLDMALESAEGKKKGEVARHVVAFEDRKDASNFGRLLELRSGSRFHRARVCPFSPKQLYKAAKEEGFKVTVLRAGQILTHVDQTLEEVEERILEVGRSSYLDREEREQSIDIDSILHQRFGL